MVHRDLKPENLFVTRDGHLKVLDFGLAKRIETVDAGQGTSAPTLSGHTQPGTIMGTLGYMSPEQLRGLSVDQRSDLFSFGAILYEMLSGEAAFKRSTSADTMSAILKEEPPALSGSRKVSTALERLVRHCLEKDPNSRFQSARDIAFALDEASGAAAVEAPVSRPRVFSTEFRARRRFLAVLAAAAVLAGGGVFLLRRSSSTPTGVGASIAVLPFTNLSSEKDQEYFSDGLAEELMALLSKVKELRVAGRMSSFAFRGQTADLASIGQKLHVAAVLEGSVRRSGEQLRVSTQLVSVKDGFQIWAETYDRKSADVFALQDEIASAVVAALKIKLLPQERLPSSEHRTSNTEAYNQYLLGRQFFGRQNLDGYRRSAAAFEKATALDPSYAAAYAGLSRTLVQLADFVDSSAEQAESRRNALWAAERAVRMGPNLAEGYAARANVRTYVGWDWAGAQADFERALSVNARDSQTHSQYGRLFARLGRLPEAIAECRKGLELDALWPGTLNILGCYLNASGQLSEARSVLSRALEISPENEYGRFFLGITLLLQKDPKAALSGVGSPTTPLRRTILALAQHDLGHEEECQRALEELISKHGQTAAYHIAEVYAWRGEPDKAFEWLDRAFLQRNSQLATIKIDPLVAKLREDPRYGAVLKKLKLPADK